jgi:hypothetical protein
MPANRYQTPGTALGPSTPPPRPRVPMPVLNLENFFPDPACALITPARPRPRVPMPLLNLGNFFPDPACGFITRLILNRPAAPSESNVAVGRVFPRSRPWARTFRVFCSGGRFGAGMRFPDRPQLTREAKTLKVCTPDLPAALATHDPWLDEIALVSYNIGSGLGPMPERG